MPYNFALFLRTSLRCSVAILPLSIAAAQMQASAQTAPKTQAQLEAEAAAAKALAGATGSEADDARAAAELGLMVTSGAGGSSQDIVVTGTNIRGVAPVGTQQIGITKEDIEAKGQTDVNQILAQIPQLGNFNQLTQVAEGGAFGFANNQNGRGLPIDPLDTGANTLVLIDGQRSAGVGSRQNVTDVGNIPSALLERIDVNTDGGSATSGSDAIGGVINFTTKRTFDGVLIGAKYGYADDYYVYDVNVTIGKTWQGGGFYVFANQQKNRALLNGDRGFYRPINYATGFLTGTQCDPPNVQVSPVVNPGIFYFVNEDGTITDSTPGTAETPVSASPRLCNLNLIASMYPAQKRNSANFALAQDFADGSIKVTIRGNYTETSREAYRSLGGANAVVRPDNPWYVAIPGQSTTAPPTQVVSFTWDPVTALLEPVTGHGNPNFNKNRLYGFNGEVVADLDGNWQLKATGKFERSNTESYARSSGNTLALNGPTAAQLAAGATPSGATQSLTTTTSLCSQRSIALTAAGGRTAAAAGNAAAIAALAAARAVCINPYNIETSDPAVILGIWDAGTSSPAKNYIISGKAVVDGTLFELPGGPVKVAAGVEYFFEHLEKKTPFLGFPFNAVDLQPWLVGERTSKSAFAEVNIPIVSSANQLTWIKELRLSLQGRYDHFSFGGSTFNPRIGINFRPTDWLKLTGNWNTGFRAPTVIDSLGLANNIVECRPISQFPNVVNPNLPHPTTGTGNAGYPSDACSLVYNGGALPDLGPQTSTNYSFAAEITPFRGFRASLSYYTVNIKDALGSFNPAAFNANAAEFNIYYPTAAEITAFIAAAVNGATFTYTPPQVYALIDGRVRNLGTNFSSGLDYRVSYSSRTSWGSVYASVSGNYKLVSKRAIKPGLPFTNLLAGGTSAGTTNFGGSGSRHNLTGTIGFNSGGGFKGSLTLNHNDGWQIARTVQRLQDRIKDFNVLNLFLGYDFKSDGVIERNLSLTLNIDNILNTDPPQNRQNGGSGFTNGGTVGRLVTIGLTKRF